MEENRDYKSDFLSLKRLHEAANSAIEDLQAKIRYLESEIALRDEKLINCQKALDINKEIMRNALIEQNRVQYEYGFEIQELKQKIKELTNANNDRLGK